VKQKKHLSSSGCRFYIIFLLLVLIFSWRVYSVQERPKAVQPPTIYQGVYVRGLTGSNLSKLTAFESDAGKGAAIVMWFQAWADPSEKLFNTDLMTAVRDHGSIPLITWEPRDFTQGPNQPHFALRNIINGSFDGYIRQFARDTKAWGHPFFLRFAHEMNDAWAPWSEQVNGNKPGQYIEAWRHVHDLFTNLQVTNVTWVWCPGAGADLQTLRELYPGEPYVDWVGMDAYNRGGSQWESFATLTQQTSQNLHMLTSQPQMIAEVGSAEQGGNKAAWITDAYSHQLPTNLPDIKAILWFDVNLTQETIGLDWRIESSLAAQQAFATALQSPVYATNQYSTLNASPIPIPQETLE
jgi:mannan endo-1,4-beta-mannosidase